MNGRPLGVQFKRNSAYVAQEDCFVPTMSANETLVFTATLTLPKSVTPEERMQRIEEVLRIMGLWRSRETQVCRLSTTPTRCALYKSPYALPPASHLPLRIGLVLDPAGCCSPARSCAALHEVSARNSAYA